MVLNQSAHSRRLVSLRCPHEWMKKKKNNNKKMMMMMMMTVHVIRRTSSQKKKKKKNFNCDIIMFVSNFMIFKMTNI